MSSESVPEKPRPSLMEATNRNVAANRQPGSNAFSGWLAAVRCGITAAGETQAMSQAAPWLIEVPKSRHSASLRAAAIRAINKDVAQSKKRTLGASLGLLAKANGGTSIAEQVGALPLMNVDAAALVLDGLIGRCARHQIEVDFLDLADVLIHWGSGAGAGGRSTDRRNRLVLDFYLAGAPATPR